MGVVAVVLAIGLAIGLGTARGETGTPPTPDPGPLAPPDTSSPRATLSSFIANMDEVHRAYTSGLAGEHITRPFRRALACLDLSETAESIAGDVGGFAALLLKEVFDRIELPDPEAIPDSSEVAARGLTHWTVPNTEITLRRVGEGERADAFLFSARSVERAAEFYQRVRHLPYRPGATHQLLDVYYENPGGMIPLRWSEWLPRWATVRLLERPIWKWAAMAVFVVVAVASIALVHALGRLIHQRFADDDGHMPFSGLILSLGVVVWAWALEVFVDDIVGMRGPLEAGIKRVALVIAFSAGIVALLALMEIIARAIIRINRVDTASAQAHFVRIVMRLVGIGFSVYFVIEASEYIGWAVAPVLAGLGVGGLAVALAARPTIENIIGGLTLFLDKPAKVGDLCRYGERLGTIEEVGLRSTRIRSLDRTVVSIPNAELSQMSIENYNRRDAMLFRAIIGLRYETTPDQLRYVLAEMRRMLVGHPKVSPDPARARFLQFGASSLDIELFAYVRTNVWGEYLAVREDLNLRIMEIIRQSGTSIAFPSQTVYWGRDHGNDPERTRKAEEEIAHMRNEGMLPFPEFAKDLLWEMEDRLDYPPAGSHGHEPRDTTPPGSTTRS